MRPSSRSSPPTGDCSRARSRASPAAWLGTIARNECRKRLGSRSAVPSELVTLSAGDATEREVARRAEIEALCTALAELPEQQRDAVVLREFYGLSYAEVAAALGLSGPAVESLLFRSRGGCRSGSARSARRSAC